MANFVPLGTASSFAVLAGSGITVAGAVNTTVVTGDIGTFPTLTETGLGNMVLHGTNHVGDATTQSAKNDLVTAYNNAAGQNTAITVPTELGGTVLGPGVYTSAAGTFTITGTLTLDGQGNPNAVWIFQAASTLITAASSNVALINSAQACNCFWQVGSSATLGTSSNLLGTVLALTSITATTSATVTGRLLARNGAVTMDTNTVSVCSLLTTPGSGQAAAAAKASASALNALAAASTCFTTCRMEEGRLAIDLYVRSMELAGITGQPNYTGVKGLAQLRQDASAWTAQWLNPALREAIALYLDIQNAVAVNAAFTATGLNAISAASNCFACLDHETKKRLLLFLKWKLNSLGEPE
jgi:hypothetical protein